MEDSELIHRTTQAQPEPNGELTKDYRQIIKNYKSEKLGVDGQPISENEKNIAKKQIKKMFFFTAPSKVAKTIDIIIPGIIKEITHSLINSLFNKKSNE